MIDVLVVGAGPAGIAACKTLIGSNAKVTLIDRHIKPGDKACAGGLTKEAWKPAGIDPKDPPPFARVFNRIQVTSSLGRVQLGNGDNPLLVTVDRTRWQRECIESLRDMGVQLALGERLLAIGDGVARTSKKNRKFDWLVGADGASSRTRRLMGLGQGLPMRARQIRIKTSVAKDLGIEIDRPNIWFDSFIACPGYGWSFPFEDEVRLGLGLSFDTGKPGELRQIFDKWLKRRGVHTSTSRIETGTIGCVYSGYRFGKVLLAGDAAGLASPLTGEGIGQALISGKEVAMEILDPLYRSKKIAGLAEKHRRTRDMLSSCFWGGPAMALAPYLLRVPFIKKETLHRYV